MTPTIFQVKSLRVQRLLCSIAQRALPPTPDAQITAQKVLGSLLIVLIKPTRGLIAAIKMSQHISRVIQYGLLHKVAPDYQPSHLER